MTEELDRRKLTFEQAEGVVPLPTQLQLKEVSAELRAYLWAILHDELTRATRHNSMGGTAPCIDGAWCDMLKGHWVYKLHKPVDEFDKRAAKQVQFVKNYCFMGDYVDLYGFLQWIIRRRDCPASFVKAVQNALVRCNASWRIIDQTFVPVGSKEGAAAITRAFAILRDAELNGARSHLTLAAERLGQGNWPDSIKESIHAVESVVRLLGGENKVSAALSKLEKHEAIHESLKGALNKLYGYTSDEQGLRHPLLEQGVAKVDETDALFLFGACAAFVTYLIGKGRTFGLIKE